MRRGRRAAVGGVVQTCTEMNSRSAPAHSKLPAVEDGPHLVVDGIRAIKEQLQADRQQVRQSLLAATPHMDIGKSDSKVRCTGWGHVCFQLCIFGVSSGFSVYLLNIVFKLT